MQWTICSAVRKTPLEELLLAKWIYDASTRAWSISCTRSEVGDKGVTTLVESGVDGGTAAAEVAGTTTAGEAVDITVPGTCRLHSNNGQAVLLFCAGNLLIVRSVLL